MKGLKLRQYVPSNKRRMDPIAFILALVGLANVFWAVIDQDSLNYLLDIRSLSVVVGGTVAILLFQFDFKTVLDTIRVLWGSFRGFPQNSLKELHQELDIAILDRTRLTKLRSGRKVNGDLINDVIYMHHKGLVFEEIDAFVTNRLKSSFAKKQAAVSLLSKAAAIAPALGLFGTVMGLIGVLRTLDNPSMIGPSMSLALMTTAYGAALGSLVFTPLAGRIEHHNRLTLQSYEELLAKIGILVSREERNLDLEEEDVV